MVHQRWLVPRSHGVVASLGGGLRMPRQLRMPLDAVRVLVGCCTHGVSAQAKTRAASGGMRPPRAGTRCRASAPSETTRCSRASWSGWPAPGMGSADFPNRGPARSWPCGCSVHLLEGQRSQQLQLAHAHVHTRTRTRRQLIGLCAHVRTAYACTICTYTRTYTRVSAPRARTHVVHTHPCCRPTACNRSDGHDCLADCTLLQHLPRVNVNVHF